MGLRGSEGLSGEGEGQHRSSHQQGEAHCPPADRLVSLPHVAGVIVGATYCACARAAAFSPTEPCWFCSSVASRGVGVLFRRMVSGYPAAGPTDAWGFPLLVLKPAWSPFSAAQESDGVRLPAPLWSGCSSQRGLNGCLGAQA